MNVKAARIVAFAIIIVALAIFVAAPQLKSDTRSDLIEQARVVRVTLSIDHIYSAQQIDIMQGESVLRILETQNTLNSKLKLSTREYSGLGTLVESMGGFANGTDNRYWQYEVNGVMPMVGAAEYVLQDGDVIAWSFTESQY